MKSEKLIKGFVKDFTAKNFSEGNKKLEEAIKVKIEERLQKAMKSVKI